MKNLKLIHRLMLLLGVFLLSLVAVGVLGISQLRQISDAQRQMYSDVVIPLRVVVDGGRQAAVHFRRMYPYILKTDQKSRQETLSLNNDTESSVLKAISLLSESGRSAELQTIGAKASRTWTIYKESVNRLYAAADAGDAEGAMNELRNHTDRLHVEMRNILVEAGKTQERLAKEDTEHMADSVERASLQILLLIGLGMAVGGGAGILLIHSVKKQLGGDPSEATKVTRLIAQGDLRQKIELRSADKSSLMFGLHSMQEQLSGIIVKVRQTSDSVSLASQEISAGTMDLSTRTEQQASALEQTAASIEELGSSARQNAENAQNVRKMAVEASEIAADGCSTVHEVVSTMRDIQKSSSRISEIIGVIDGIAFQTNILALNAAVEAARAGEQGRGFAVVASEVRSLAQRSAEAAKEIKLLINASTSRIGQGAILVDQAGEKMKEVAEAISRVADRVSEISAASSEQSVGVAQVSEAVTMMDQSTQQNAALVEQSAAAAQALKSQALQLVQVVAAFDVADNTANSVFTPVFPRIARSV